MKYTTITLEIARKHPQLIEKVGRSISVEELAKLDQDKIKRASHSTRKAKK